MEDRNGNFSYTYSANQQEEVKRIRQKYVPNEESKMDTLRKLDKSVDRPGMIAAITLGIIGMLLFGAGMTCTMVWTDFFVLGVVVGVIGMIILAVCYPVFKMITKMQRVKIAPQILELSEELMK